MPWRRPSPEPAVSRSRHDGGERVLRIANPGGEPSPRRDGLPSCSRIRHLSAIHREIPLRDARPHTIRHPYGIDCEITTRAVRPYKTCRVSRHVTYRAPLTW